MDDRRIIELFFSRKDSAITELSKQYAPMMLTICSNILQNQEDAKECFNSALLALWDTIPPQRPQSLSAYCARICRNTALTRYKKNKAEKRNDQKSVSLEEIGDILPSEQSIELTLERQELTKAIEEWLSGLEQKNRYLFIRKYWYMDDAKTLAQNTGLSTSAVYLRIDRMKKSLLTHLKTKGVLQ
ncbi:MAG: sigma-70 family RNA polymerase sigma factor [Clostridia bacterium]|nr:sigma-70 family RNA polymerase sigma factor [Clostridia bacterium]